MKNKKNKTKSNTTNDNENKEKEGEMKFSQTLLSSKIGSVLTKRPYDLNLSHKTEKIENPFHEILIRDDVLSKKECDSIVASICSILSINWPRAEDRNSEKRGGKTIGCRSQTRN